MNTTEYLIVDEPLGKTRSFVVGSLKVPAPCYMPEVRGDECVEAILRYSKALDTNNPVIVPGYKWASIASNPRYKSGDLLTGRISIEEFLTNHPVIFYEPPEMFRYAMKRKFISYALKGDRQRARKFNKALTEGKSDDALMVLPEFFRPFAKRQLMSIYHDLGQEAPEGIEKTRDIEKVWLDEKIVDLYPAHMGEIINDAMGMPHAAVIPTVPPLTKSSEGTMGDRILSSNKMTNFLCNLKTAKTINPVRSYFHLYVDAGILGYDAEDWALRLLESGLDSSTYCGVALTLTSYEDNGKLSKICDFVNDVVNVSHSNHLPVILPRSGWYGLYMTDFGAQAFSSMMNGKLEYSCGGGNIEEEDKFGKVPIIDKCRELKLKELREYIGKNGGLPKVPNLPTKFDVGLLANPIKFRSNFAKPLRLIHVEEARRIRKGQMDSVRTPAKQYFNKSEHERLKNL